MSAIATAPIPLSWMDFNQTYLWVIEAVSCQTITSLAGSVATPVSSTPSSVPSEGVVTAAKVRPARVAVAIVCKLPETLTVLLFTAMV